MASFKKKRKRKMAWVVLVGLSVIIETLFPISLPTAPHYSGDQSFTGTLLQWPQVVPSSSSNHASPNHIELAHNSIARPGDVQQERTLQDLLPRTFEQRNRYSFLFSYGSMFLNLLVLFLVLVLHEVVFNRHSDNKFKK